MDDDTLTDAEIWNAAIAGRIRCLNAQNEGMSVLRPNSENAHQSYAALHDELSTEFGESALRFYYLELLSRAESFMEFYQGNVGPTADFPLRVRGESVEATEEFHDQLNRLGAVVGVLTEFRA